MIMDDEERLPNGYRWTNKRTSGRWATDVWLAWMLVWMVWTRYCFIKHLTCIILPVWRAGISNKPVFDTWRSQQDPSTPHIHTHYTHTFNLLLLLWSLFYLYYLSWFLMSYPAFMCISTSNTLYLCTLIWYWYSLYILNQNINATCNNFRDFTEL